MMTVRESMEPPESLNVVNEVANALRVARATKMTGTMVIEIHLKDGGVARAYCSVKQAMGKRKVTRG